MAECASVPRPLALLYIAGVAALMVSACGGSPAAPTPIDSPVPPVAGTSALSQVRLEVDTIEGGQSIPGTVILTGEAPEGGLTVALSSSASVVAVPETVTVTAGAMTATFVATTVTVHLPVTLTITGVAGGVTRTANLHLTAIPALAQVSIAAADVTGGHATTGTVTLTVPARESGMPVALSSTHPAVTVPSAVVVAAGTATATFSVDTQLVSGDTIATITAVAEGVQRTAMLKVSRGTFLSFQSDPGDYIGLGGTLDRTLEGAVFQATVDTPRNVVSVTARAVDWSWWWYLYLKAPDSTPLMPGTYLDARRWPFQPAGHPGLSFWGDGRGCNTLTGRFTVEDVTFGPGPTVERLDATFVQHCEGASPALRGRIRIRADPWR